jgi:hypothetical protein
MAPKKTKKKTAEKKQDLVCPVCDVLGYFSDVAERNSPFLEHMNNARIEFLEGIKSLIDARIDILKKGPGSKKSKRTKIKVED